MESVSAAFRTPKVVLLVPLVAFICTLPDHVLLPATLKRAPETPLGPAPLSETGLGTLPPAAMLICSCVLVSTVVVLGNPPSASPWVLTEPGAVVTVALKVTALVFAIEPPKANEKVALPVPEALRLTVTG